LHTDVDRSDNALPLIEDGNGYRPASAMREARAVCWAIPRVERIMKRGLAAAAVDND
jgi:hypothetical protein